jgi:hypothetical protein
MGGFALKIMIGLIGALIVCSVPAYAQRLWCWSLAGSGVSAAGTFLTLNDPDVEGFYRIAGINGTANFATITALQPAGTSSPGNAGFAVDNLVRTTAPQLSKHGFGFVASDGTYHNPFHAEQYRDYISRPPYVDGKGAEPAIQFKAFGTSDSRCSTQ